MKVIDYSKMSKLINIALASVKIKEIKLAYNNKVIRPQMHLLLYGGIGTGKSTILYEVRDKIKQECYTGLTRATILGAVDKATGMFSPPAIWDAKNSALLIDEFFVSKYDNNAREMLKTLLQVLEKPEYTKRIGFRCNEWNEKKKDLYCKVKDNKITCKTKFIFFANTMMNLAKTQMTELIALKSRCLVIPYYPSLEDIKRKMKGKEHYIYKEYKKVPEKLRISKKLSDWFMDLLDDKKVSTENYMRTFGDLCRTYAIVKKNEEIFKLIIDLSENK